MSGLGYTTIVVRRAALVEDALGNETRDWVHASSTTVEGCDVQPVDSTETTLGRETVVSRWRLFAPRTIDLLATDRVEADGKTYDVDGDVQTWDEHPASSSYVEALLRRAEQL